MKRRALVVCSVAFSVGVIAALAWAKARPVVSPGNVVASATAKLEALPMRLAARANPSTSCPPLTENPLVLSVELDDLQGASADWHFLADDNIDALRGSGDVKAADEVNAAAYLVLFAADTEGKQLPTQTQDGLFRGSMVLVDVRTGAAVCGRPIEVRAPAAAFRATLREQAIVVAQTLGVRVGLPQLR